MTMVIAWIIAGPTIGTTMDGRAPMVMFWVIAAAVSEPRWAILDDPTAEDRGAADGGRGSPPTKVVVAQLSEDWRSAHASWSEEMAVEWEGVGGMGDAEEPGASYRDLALFLDTSQRQ